MTNDALQAETNATPQGTLFHGDNLTVLRSETAASSVQLIYLDPPFNSARDYSILPGAATKQPKEPRQEAFSDTWVWSEHAAREFEILSNGASAFARALTGFRAMLGEGDMLAYLAHMAPRLVELHRVLHAHGSLYLHCDPSASHYLKVLLDSLFGAANFRREIIWKSGWISGFKSRAHNWIRNHDVILYYVKDARSFTFNKTAAYKPHPPGYRRRGGGENPLGSALDDVWTEPELYSPWIKSFSSEKLGYMTQKPLALLSRIIAASSNAGDVVLDPYCGSGTTLHAAQLLGRRWIGIDSGDAAITLTRTRLRDAFGDAVI